MRKLLPVITLCVVLAAVVGLFAPKWISLGSRDAAGSGSGKTTASSSISACPVARPLPPDAVARAAEEALREAPRLYRGIDTRGAFVAASARAEAAGARGQEVRVECGERVFERTVVVELRFPRMLPSASLSEGVVFVSLLKRPHRYRVWEVAH